MTHDIIGNLLPIYTAVVGVVWWFVYRKEPLFWYPFHRIVTTQLYPGMGYIALSFIAICAAIETWQLTNAVILFLEMMVFLALTFRESKISFIVK